MKKGEENNTSTINEEVNKLNIFRMVNYKWVQSYKIAINVIAGA